MRLLERERPSAPTHLEVPADSHFAWWLALVASVALVLRILVVYHARSASVSGDGVFYGLQAHQNAAGHWFVGAFNGQPDALHPPAWVLVLTTLDWLGGRSWLSQQLLACVIGTATVVVIGLAGRRIAGDRVGLIAAGIAAVYAGLWVYERALLSEALLLLGIAVMILIAYRFHDRPSALLAAFLGVMCGLLALTRSEQILVWPLLAAPLILLAKQFGWRRRIGWLALAGVSMLLVIAPWTMYNLGRFQHPVLLSNNFGSAVAQGNCDLTYYGAHTGWYGFECGILDFHTNDQTVWSGDALKTGESYAKTHLHRLPIVLVAREGRTFGFWDPFQQVILDAQWSSLSPSFGSLSYVSAAIWVNRLALFSLWLMLIPAVAGAVVLRRRRIPIYPLLAFIATVLVAVAVTYGEPRYRAAAEVPIVLLAAVAIETVLPSKHSTPSTSTGVRKEQSNNEGSSGDLEPTTAVAPAPRSPATTFPSSFAMVGLALLVAGAIVGIAAANRTQWTADQTRPATFLIAPSSGTRLANIQALEAIPRDAVGVTRVEFHVTGGHFHDALIGAGKSNTVEWVTQWNTTMVPNGTYTMQAIAYDTVGRAIRSPLAIVTIGH